MNKLSFFLRAWAIIGLGLLIFAQNGCDICCKDDCKNVKCENPVVNNPSYYNSDYEVALSWTEEAKTTYLINAYMPSLQQVIAYEVQGGNATLQMAQLYPLSLTAETDCCEKETLFELEAACNFPDSFSITIITTDPLTALFEWSAVAGATEYLITVYDSLGNNIQQIAVPGANTNIEVELDTAAYYAVIQTNCGDDEYSPESPPVRTTIEPAPIAASVDVEKINDNHSFWSGRITLTIVASVRFLDLTVVDILNNLNNNPLPSGSYTVRTSYDSGNSWSLTPYTSTKISSPGNSLTFTRISVLPGTVIVEAIIAP